MEVRRSLLAIAPAADWVPKDGERAGDFCLQVVRVSSLHEAKKLSTRDTWDVVAFRVDRLHPLVTGAAVEALRSLAPEATFLAVTDRPDVHEAIAYLKQGVYEYLEEPLSPATFLRALGEAIENRDAFREILNLNRSLEAQKDQLEEEKVLLEKKNRELEAVSRVTRAVSSSLELEQILDHLGRCIQETFGFERILIGLLDAAAAVEVARVIIGEPKPIAEAPQGALRWQLREGKRQPWIHAVLQKGQVLRVEDPASHPLTKGTALAALHRGRFVKIPMAARGRIVGSITVDNPATGRRVEDEEMEILGIFADSGAMAVENARLYQTMKELSVRDELTGLFNRRHFQQQLEAEWNHAERHEMSIALLMIDVDHFKSFNDLNDHLAGDAALRKVAKVLMAKTRGIDTVARFGGEEFTVILPRTSKRNASIVAEKLRSAVASTAFEGESAMAGGKLTVSVGLAAYPEDAGTSLELLERADWALYQAKAGGRNQVAGWRQTEQAATV